MKFVELFGMPATGKTFAIKSLKKKSYKKNERKVFFAFKKRSIFSFFFKLKFIFFSLNVIIKSSIFRHIINFFRKEYIPKRSKLISLRTLSILFNSLFLIAVLKHYGNSVIKKDIYLDQGFFQILFSILYEMDLSDKRDFENIIKKWLKNISLINQNIFLFYCISEDEKIIERLSSREGDSIIEKKEINKNDFKIYKKIFENIVSFLIYQKKQYPMIHFKCIDLDEYNNELFKFE